MADAVRASMSIPYFFEPKKLKDVDEKEHLLVDGGVLSNYPLEVFDRTDGKRPRWPTFGVTLLPPLPAGSTQIFPQLRGLRRVGALGFLESLVTTLVVGRDQGYLNQPWVKARSMQVDNLGINPVDFGITKDEAARLFQSGHDRAEAFLRHLELGHVPEHFSPVSDPADLGVAEAVDLLARRALSSASSRGHASIGSRSGTARTATRGIRGPSTPGCACTRRTPWPPPGAPTRGSAMGGCPAALRSTARPEGPLRGGGQAAHRVEQPAGRGAGAEL